MSRENKATSCLSSILVDSFPLCRKLHQYQRKTWYCRESVEVQMPLFIFITPWNMKTCIYVPWLGRVACIHNLFHLSALLMHSPKFKMSRYGFVLLWIKFCFLTDFMQRFLGLRLEPVFCHGSLRNIQIPQILFSGDWSIVQSRLHTVGCQSLCFREEEVEERWKWLQASK